MKSNPSKTHIHTHMQREREREEEVHTGTERFEFDIPTLICNGSRQKQIYTTKQNKKPTFDTYPDIEQLTWNS